MEREEKKKNNHIVQKVANTTSSTDAQNSLMDSVGEGEGGKIWENGIETCKISCMK